MNNRKSDSTVVTVEVLERRDFFSVSTDASLAAPDVDGGEAAMLLPAIQAAREGPQKSTIWDQKTEQSRQISVVVDM